MKTKICSEYISTIINKIDKLSSFAGKFSGILAFILMFFISADVAFRYFLNSPIPGTFEISRLSLTWICFLGIFSGYSSKAHVRVTILTSRLPKYQSHFEFIAGIFWLLVFSFLIFESTFFFWDSFMNREAFPGLIPVPYWLAKLSMPVGSLLLLIAVFFNTAFHFLKIFEKEA